MALMRCINGRHSTGRSCAKSRITFLIGSVLFWSKAKQPANSLWRFQRLSCSVSFLVYCHREVMNASLLRRRWQGMNWHNAWDAFSLKVLLLQRKGFELRSIDESRSDTLPEVSQTIKTPDDYGQPLYSRRETILTMV